ncbi:MAG: M15 family metallopeptidase [Clostridia bacterium]|nr:M15 family metallopeptidase [Clostridia bacterium]
MLRIVNKKKFIRGISIIIAGIAIIVILMVIMIKGIISLFAKAEDGAEETKITTLDNTIQTYSPSTIQNTVQTTSQTTSANTEVLNEWNLKLVNKNNSVDRSYVPELEELDDGIMFDKRAISYLRSMINAMNKKGITKVWVQSAYRSYEKQEELFNRKVQYYKNQGKKQEEAETLAQTVVQRPEMSEHNLGLAADFNTVNNEFEKTKAFEWLQENAADYGFILRYPKDKQEITGITYESWHWRYVGENHAKTMKEKGYCLEEYIEYLKGAESV